MIQFLVLAVLGGTIASHFISKKNKPSDDPSHPQTSSEPVIHNTDDPYSYQLPAGYKETSFCGLNLQYATAGREQDSLEKYHFKHESDITDNRSIYSNEQGQKAIVIYESVPAFDSGDREWDSYRKLYLIPENEKVIGFKVYGGYKIARIEYFPDVRWGDEKTKKFMDDTGVFKKNDRID